MPTRLHPRHPEDLVSDILDAIRLAVRLLLGLDAALLQIVALSLVVSLSARPRRRPSDCRLGAARRVPFPGTLCANPGGERPARAPPVVVGLALYLLLSRSGRRRARDPVHADCHASPSSCWRCRSSSRSAIAQWKPYGAIRGRLAGLRREPPAGPSRIFWPSGGWHSDGESRRVSGGRSPKSAPS